MGRRLWHPGLYLALAVVLALGLAPGVTGGQGLRESMFTILMSVGLASSLNILVGYTGYVSFGHIVFFGLGGYVGFYTMTQLGWPLPLAALVGGVAAGILAFILGRILLRLRGAYFALATLGILEAMRAFVTNFSPFGGSIGLSLNFSAYRAYGGANEALWLTYWILVGLVVLTVVVSYLVRKSKFGLGLMAIREDEHAAEIMGVRASRAKTWALVLSAVIPGVIGVLFFFKNGSIEPSDAFRLNQSIELLVMVMLGGQGTVLGPVLGAFGYQRLRGYLLTSALFSDIQLTIAGILLLLIVLFIPAGAVGWLRRRIPRLKTVLE